MTVGYVRERITLGFTDGWGLLRLLFLRNTGKVYDSLFGGFMYGNVGVLGTLLERVWFYKWSRTGLNTQSSPSVVVHYDDVL